MRLFARILPAAVGVLLVAAAADQADAFWPNFHANQDAERRANWMPWHGGYYNAAWGQPLALVVPPTANTRTSLSWGVAQTEVNSILHQYHRRYPGYGGDFSQFRPTPYWPSHTDQFGTYYIRGPWGHY